MARIVALLGTPHNPFHHRSISRAREQWTADTVRRVEKAATFREKLRQADPDALVMIGNDHFHQFFMDNMPAFCIGKMEQFDGTYYNEEREFALPGCRIPGDATLAHEILVAGLHSGIDFAFSNELKVDHSIVVPLMLLRPEMDLPIVPIMTNCIAPPLPSAERYYQVGRILRTILESVPSDKRIGVIVTGHVALDIGGMYQGRPPDDTFSQQALGWIAAGDASAAIHECTYERLIAAGNQTPGFLNFLLALGLAHGAPASYTELDDPGEEDFQGFFAWDDVATSTRA